MEKNKSSLKDDFNKHPVVFLLLFAALIVTAAFILLKNLGTSGPIWPTPSNIKLERKALKKKQKELQVELDLLQQREMDIDSFKSNSQNFWIFQRDGNPKLDLKEKINNAAAQHGFILSSIDTVRSDNITDGVDLMSTNIRGEGTFQNLTLFLGEIQNMKPKFYWQNITIRPKSSQNPNDSFTLIGSIQIVAINDEKITKFLLESK